MTTAAVALRAAIHHALSADSGLSAALGGAHVYDEPPRNAAFPYVTLGEARVSNAAVDGGPTLEHQLTLHAWSRQGGHKEAHVITGALLAALDDAPLPLGGHPGLSHVLDEFEEERIVPSCTFQFSAQRCGVVWMCPCDVEGQASEHGEVGGGVVLAIARQVLVEHD
ncbi:hypothetical protein HNR60_002585, partial [Rhodopseudomonas rhenobacensis]|nr:hypothetical protein [Rhodopseudomonas rhenobacensis]